MMKYSILSILSFFCLSCYQGDKLSTEKLNNKGEIVALPYYWKKSIHVGGKRNFVGVIYGNLVFDDKLIITISDGPQKRDLTMIDTKNADEAWKWNESYQPATEAPTFDHYVVYQNILHWIVGSRHYAIDIATGKTMWKDRKEDSYHPRMKNIDHTVYFTGPIKDTMENYKTNSGYRRSIFDASLEQFLVQPFNFDMIGEANRITAIEHIVPYTENKLIVITSQAAPNWYHTPNLNLYDLESNSWIYHSKEVVPLSQNNSVISPTIYNNRIYFTAGIHIVCHDIATGNQIWQKAFPADFLFSGFIIEEGILVANCEDQVLYGIDPDHGYTLWTGRGSGTSSPLQDRVLNGVAYFTGGGPSNVFAVDIHTGKTLWALEAEEFEPSGRWKGDTYVIPGKNGEKGRVVVCTMMHCYCFDAAR